ncbi:ABC transporter G family member 25 [Linum grandiflorum]
METSHPPKHSLTIPPPPAATPQTTVSNNSSSPAAAAFILSSVSLPITLKFVDLCYRVKLPNKAANGSSTCGIGRLISPNQKPTADTDHAQERTILNGITGMVSPGEILAVLGPSGSGKSTLLNALAGRLNRTGHSSLTGSVTANDDKKMTARQIVRRTGFVTQDDVLYPHLTVRETLVYCALLRLSTLSSRDDKVAAAEWAITELGLGKCADTMIGNSFVRGVSGGERKRVSIAHELLINPSLLILDEPTSGLDSTAAFRLVATLGQLAKGGKRTVVTSVHQPSSRVYQMFDSVLVLSEGRSLYFGKGCEAMGYFESVGYSPSFPMNPADFLLDLANGFSNLDGTAERDKPNVKQNLVASYNAILAPKVKSACLEATVKEFSSVTNGGNNNSSSSTRHRSYRGENRVSLTTWFHQFTILLCRSLKERRHESFNTLRVFQVLAGALLAGLMWWHSDFQDIQDRLGLLFFISIFWGVLPSFNAVFAFPQERAIFMKERASGMYTLSSYFMARIVGDMPMELALPSIFIAMAYWMTGMKPDLGAFLLTLLILLGYVLVSQGLGLALGAAIMDAKQASTLATVTMLAFVLTGGFYVHKVPACMAWMKYVSTTFYTYRLLINVQYGDGERIAKVLGCSGRNGSNGGDGGANCKFVRDDVQGQISPWFSVGVMVFMFVGYRVLAYLALRRIRT